MSDRTKKEACQGLGTETTNNELILLRIMRSVMRLSTIATIFGFAIFASSCNSTETATTAQATKMHVKIHIDYGGQFEPVDRELKWKKTEITALEALQAVAKVETHPKAGYIFVSSIDGLAGVRGVNAWYYTVNGKKSDKLAVWNNLKDGDIVNWIYKDDVCSKEVDGK